MFSQPIQRLPDRKPRGKDPAVHPGETCHSGTEGVACPSAEGGRAAVATCGSLGLWLGVTLKLKFWYQLAFSARFCSCVHSPLLSR